MTEVSRRTVAKGAAWAVPVIAVGAAAPAFAASGDGPRGVFLDACKQPGNSCNNDFGFVKGYTFTFSITNDTGQLIYVYPTINGDTSWDGNPVNPVLALVSDPAKNFSYATARRFTGGAIGVPLLEAEPIAPGGTLTIIVNAGVNGNSSNISADGLLNMAWGHTATPGSDIDHSYTNFTGEGWFNIPISFDSTPPCGTDCAPGGDETETP